MREREESFYPCLTSWFNNVSEKSLHLSFLNYFLTPLCSLKESEGSNISKFGGTLLFFEFNVLAKVEMLLAR